MRASYSSRTDERCKRRATDPPDKFPPVTPPPRPIPLDPDEKARRLAALRAALAGSAPAFQARIRLGQEAHRP